MGIGLVIVVMAMVSAGIVECYRLKCEKRLHMLWGFKLLKHILPNSSVCICRSFWSSYVCSSIGVLQCTNTRWVKRALEVHFAWHLSLLGTIWAACLWVWLWRSQLRSHARMDPRKSEIGHLDRFYFLLATLKTVDRQSTLPELSGSSV